MSKPLTQPQMNALRALADIEDNHRLTTPRNVAKALWPDSEAWNRRTRGRRTGKINGAIGGTMPMKAATLLWRLDARGCATCPLDSSTWEVTSRGRRVLAGTDEPLPVAEKQAEPIRQPKLKPARTHR